MLIHTSLKAIGEIEGGGDTLLDAFKEYLSEGIFIVPTHTWASINAQNPVYNPRTEKCCIGVLPNLAAFRPDFIRSLHPTHSVAAAGKRAAEFVSGEEYIQTPGGKGGVWSRLYDEGAKILLLGVKHNRNTYFHAVDEMIGLPNRIATTPYTVTIKKYDGTEISHDFYGHYCPYTNDVSQFYVKYEDTLKAEGAVEYGVLGNAEVRICDAVKCAESIRGIWNRAEKEIWEW